MKFLKLFILTLLIATPLTLLNGCGGGSSSGGVDGAGAGSQFIASTGGTAELVGSWYKCQTDGNDVEFSYTFTETAYSLRAKDWTSTDGSCTGDSFPAIDIDDAYTIDGTKTIVAWSDAFTVVAAPLAGNGDPLLATPTVQKLAGYTFAGDPTDNLLAYIDDTGDVDRLYLDTEWPSSPCDFDVNDYAGCLSTYVVMERQ